MNQKVNKAKQPKLSKKLVLRKESIRILSDDTLGKVVGGLPRMTYGINCLSLPKGTCF